MQVPKQKVSMPILKVYGHLGQILFGVPGSGVSGCGFGGGNSTSHEIINDRKSPKTNVELKHESLEDDAPLQRGDVRVIFRLHVCFCLFSGCLSVHSRYLLGNCRLFISF